MSTKVAEATSVEDEYSVKKSTLPYYIPLVIVFLAWGVVPAFAELAGLSGDMTTFWVNWIALPTVALFITLLGGWKVFGAYSLKSYLIMIALGLIWPLAYSVSYFGSVVENGSAMTSILNNSWPIFYLLSAFFVYRESLKQRRVFLSVLSIVIAVGGVLTTLYLESDQTFILAPALFLGLFAALTQGLYSASTDRWKYDPWVMTFVVEAVTCVGVTVMVVINNSFVWPSWHSLGYLALIGAVSNGLGFWAFLSGSQESGKGGFNQKTTWLVGMCLVPFGQVLISLITGCVVKPLHWIGISIVVAALLLNAMSKLRK